MEIEEIGPGGGGLEQGDGVAPMIAVGATNGEIMRAGKARKIGGRDERATGDIVEVAGELRPEGGFEA